MSSCALSFDSRVVTVDYLRKGTPATREFYNRIGWQRQDGVLVDSRMFGWTDGPIRRALETARHERLLRATGGPGLKLAELGCGGTPATFLVQRCARYTGVDFSAVALTEATTALRQANVAFETIEADFTDLPFENGAFDVVYSAHAIYHIDRAEGQAAAFDEALRIVRPGGAAVFILANPFPLLFPVRLARRLLAVTPGLNFVLNRLRTKPPLPYLPMPIGWMKARLSKWGAVEIEGYAVPSVKFDRSVSERTFLGRLIWRSVAWLEANQSKLAARLGCYVLITVRKSG